MIVKKVSVLIIGLLLFVCTAFAQKNSSPYNPGKYKKEPLWIKMMDDPQVNYFETLKAFREYYKDRKLPKEPFENEEMEVFEKEVGLVTDKESEEKRERKLERKRFNKNEQDYSAEVRAFKGWMQGVKPWVRADGSIISAAEQQQILDKQNLELKTLEIQNGKK